MDASPRPDSMPPPAEGGDPLVFGFAPSIEGDRTRHSLVELCRALGGLVGRELVPMRVASYEALERALAERRAAIAWLPPVLLARLSLAGAVTPVAQCVRAGLASYHACLFVREGASIERLADLREVRAAWVDRSSAAGYVFPRLMLAASGIDPTLAFSQELFLQSHAEVVRAVLAGTADVGATFATMRPDGTIVRGGWTDPDGTNAKPIRVLSTFGPIPNDAMAIRSDLPAALAGALARATTAVSSTAALRPALRHLFGADALAPVNERAFDELRVLVGDAMKQGMTVGG
jgi:phosphate/phosphite/phosphonate ABC transporter binding protein